MHACSVLSPFHRAESGGGERPRVEYLKFLAVSYATYYWRAGKIHTTLVGGER